MIVSNLGRYENVPAPLPEFMTSTPEPAQVSSSDSPIDLEALETLRKLQKPGSPNILEQVIDLYLSNAPELRTRMSNGLDRLDAEEVRSAAHTLKASSANIGAHALAELCKRVEDLAREANLDDVPDMTGPLYAEYERVLDALHSQVLRSEDSPA